MNCAVNDLLQVSRVDYSHRMTQGREGMNCAVNDLLQVSRVDYSHRMTQGR